MRLPGALAVSGITRCSTAQARQTQEVGNALEYKNSPLRNPAWKGTPGTAGPHTSGSSWQGASQGRAAFTSPSLDCKGESFRASRGKASLSLPEKPTEPPGSFLLPSLLCAAALHGGPPAGLELLEKRCGSPASCPAPAQWPLAGSSQRAGSASRVGGVVGGVLSRSRREEGSRGGRTRTVVSNKQFEN